MGAWSHLCNDDDRNDGWTVVGSGITHLWEAWDNDDDTKYAQCPAYKGYGAVLYPVDITQVPAGAVITSITVKLRCATGAGSPPSNTPASITVQTSCKDDTSRFTTRTIYPTSTITTFEVATYTRDCLGLLWDIERINKLICRVFSYGGVFDLIRCYKLYVDIKYRVRPTVVITGPTGTQYTPSPVISWTYTQTDGDPQSKVQYRLFTGIQQADVSFDPDRTAPVYDTTLSGDIRSVTLPTSIDPDTYWVYVRVTSSFGARSVWVGQQFTVSGPKPGIPGVPDPTGTAPSGTGIIQVVPDSVQGSATLTIRDTSNMMTIIEADAEISSDTSTLASSAVNNTVSRDTSTAFPGGIGSWKLSSTAAGTMSVTSDWVEVAPSTPVTARCQFLSAVSARTCNVRITFYDATFTSISTLTGSATDATGTWTEASATGTTPLTTAYATTTFEVASTAAASEVHWIDHLGLMYGTNTPWSDGGHMGRNLLSSYYSDAQSTATNSEGWTPTSGTTMGTAAPTGAGRSGSVVNTMTYAGITPSLAVRGVGATFTTPTTGNDFTLNMPTVSAPVAGDLMLAYVYSSKYSSTINPPAGWTFVDSARVSIDGTKDTAMYVLKKTAGVGEVTVSGTLGTSSARRGAIVVVYSGAADASLQFIAESAASTANTSPTFITPPAVYNTDPNAWRVSAFVFNSNVTGGTATANVQQPSIIPPISYVGRASAWTNGTSQTSYTINKPTGVQSGDLMIAVIGFAASNGTITPPTGWTTVTSNSGTNGPYAQTIFKRTAGASEPASWSGSISGSTWTNTNLKLTQCVAYRNCADASLQFVSNAMNFVGGSTSVSTPSVTNSNSSAWRVCIFGADADQISSWSSNENIERVDNSTHATFGGGDDSITVSVSDSNGAIGTGSYTKSATLSSTFYNAGAWMGFIKPLSSPPASVPNEVSRASTTVGSANPWLTIGAYDSNGVVSIGNQQVSGIFAPGGGGTMESAGGWIGLIKPATPVRAGQVGTSMSTTVDISSVDSSIMSLAGSTASVSAAFLGSTSGTPYLQANFYRANQLISSSIGQGSPFGTATWQKSAVSFAIPTGTTRMSVSLVVTDRNVSDVVYFNRVSLAFGSSTTYRSGTYRAAHPIFAVPVLQYADDPGTGYGPWTDLPGQIANPPIYDPFTGLITFIDHTVTPLVNRKYRSKTLSYGLSGDRFVSAWGPDSSEFNFVASNWWLKDISNPANNLELKVKYDTVSIGTTNSATIFQPLGEDLPVVLTEGFKGDSFTLSLIPVNQSDYAQLRLMLKSNKTLFLQSDVDNAWWVRPVGDIGADILPTSMRQSNPLREIKVTFVQVKPEL